MINRFRVNFFTNIKKYFIVKKENKKDNSIENKIIILKYQINQFSKKNLLSKNINFNSLIILFLGLKINK